MAVSSQSRSDGAALIFQLTYLDFSEPIASFRVAAKAAKVSKESSTNSM